MTATFVGVVCDAMTAGTACATSPVYAPPAPSLPPKDNGAAIGGGIGGAVAALLLLGTAAAYVKKVGPFAPRAPAAPVPPPDVLGGSLKMLFVRPAENPGAPATGAGATSAASAAAPTATNPVPVTP